MLDVAAVAEAILLREPPSTLLWAGSAFGFEPDEVALALAARVGLHDIGKTLPGFQAKWPEGRQRLESLGLRFPSESLLEAVNRHDWACFDLLPRLFCGLEVEDPSIREFARALAAHHGAFPPGSSDLGLEKDEWPKARLELLRAYWGTLAPAVPRERDLSSPAMAWFAGLASVADWIGSNTDWFPMGERGATLQEHWESARDLAERALDALGWPAWSPLLRDPSDTDSLVRRMLGREDLDSRPLQAAADALLAGAEGPTLLLVEAPMGEGKTELAFLSHLRLQACNQHRGLFLALPTQATGNAMFDRALAFLRAFSGVTKLDIQLVHGGALLDERVLRLRNIGDSPGSVDESIASSAWFSARKRPLLSPYGVGTVDQALMSVLCVKHHFVRLWGLSNRVVVLDEVHAYDTYTGGLIEALLRWLKDLGCSVVLMSATLPERRRAALLQAWGAQDRPEIPYPRVLMASAGRTEGLTFPVRDQVPIQIQGLAEDLVGIANAVVEAVREGGCAAVIVNTVQRAQTLYLTLKALAAPGVELQLFHARLPADDRQARERRVLEAFGKDSDLKRPERAILVATQVAEQSLDVDFDVMFTDLAPIDLLLQRAGRLHRHDRRRPACHADPVLHISGLGPDREPELKETG